MESKNTKKIEMNEKNNYQRQKTQQEKREVTKRKIINHDLVFK